MTSVEQLAFLYVESPCLIPFLFLYYLQTLQTWLPKPYTPLHSTPMVPLFACLPPHDHSALNFNVNFSNFLCAIFHPTRDSHRTLCFSWPAYYFLVFHQTESNSKYVVIQVQPQGQAVQVLGSKQ